MGFEPTHAEHIGLAVQRLNHSATSSHNISHSKLRSLMWQTFCIPLGLECCRYVFMCNDRNVLLRWQIGQLLQSLRLTMNDVSFTTQKNRTTPFWKTKRPWGRVGESEGIDWSDCVSTTVKRLWHFFIIIFYLFSVISFNISWRNCPPFFSKWWASLSLKILNLRPILLCSQTSMHREWCDLALGSETLKQAEKRQKTLIKGKIRLDFEYFVSIIFFWCLNEKKNDEDGIRTHACRAHWISSPTP